MADTERPKASSTKPPPPSVAAELDAFEKLIKAVGEGRARWSRLLTLLEQGAGT